MERAPRARGGGAEERKVRFASTDAAPRLTPPAAKVGALASAGACLGRQGLGCGGGGARRAAAWTGAWSGEGARGGGGGGAGPPGRRCALAGRGEEPKAGRWRGHALLGRALHPASAAAPGRTRARPGVGGVFAGSQSCGAAPRGLRHAAAARGQAGAAPRAVRRVIRVAAGMPECRGRPRGMAGQGSPRSDAAGRAHGAPTLAPRPPRRSSGSEGESLWGKRPERV